MNVDLVYDVLVEECGAHDSDDARFSFAHLWPDCIEYRFMGDLGFGGKVWASHGKVYVSCYPEDRTPERNAAINRANLRLEAL